MIHVADYYPAYTGLRRESKCGGRGDSTFQHIKGLLFSCTPQPVSQLLGECVEGAGNLGEVVDESLVEVHEPYEGLDILDLHWSQPVCDSLDLNGVHCYMVLRDNKPKVVHLSMFKLALLQSEE